MASRRRKATRYLTASAILSALGVILLTVGALVEVLDLSMAAIASLTVVLAVMELKGKYPFLIYLVTSVLALLLLPSKLPALLYALFAGYYPMLKSVYESKLSRPLGWVLKVLTFNAAFLLIAFLSVKLFALYEWQFSAWQLLLPLGATAVFLLYDVALTRLITAYLFRWRTRFRFFGDE